MFGTENLQSSVFTYVSIWQSPQNISMAIISFSFCLPKVLKTAKLTTVVKDNMPK